MRQISIFLGKGSEPIGALFCEDKPVGFKYSFEYKPSWLSFDGRFAVDPSLPLICGRQAKSPALGLDRFFGVIADSGPDGWSLSVINRAKNIQDNNFNLSEMSALDFLLHVRDDYRIGALRYQDESGRMCGGCPKSRPRMIKLPQILDAVTAFEYGEETVDQISGLFAESTAFGGIRPKASMVDTNKGLWIAKFPSVKDIRSMTKGEGLALKLARMAGVNVCSFKMQSIEGRGVIMVKRFDRTISGQRLHYASAKTMLEAEGDVPATYAGIADTIRRHGFDVHSDLEELYRRMVLNILISNSDDHSANHGFIYVANGRWMLSPAFDINPYPETPASTKTRISWDTGTASTIDNCLAESPKFALQLSRAKSIIGEIGRTMRQWRAVAMSIDVGMTESEADLFQPAFEHKELATAVALQEAR